jgi:hypothetical protein
LVDVAAKLGGWWVKAGRWLGGVVVAAVVVKGRERGEGGWKGGRRREGRMDG